MTKFVLILILITSAAQAKIIDYQTTRLKSTGGTGVGSLLIDEATVLNPAPLAFFKISSFYIQKSDTEHLDENKNTTDSSSNYAVIASDSSKNLKGSVSYVKSKDGRDKYELIATSFSSLLGQKSALGFTYQKVKKEENFRGLEYKSDYQQVNIGVTHLVSPNLTLGIVAIDPFRKSANDTAAIVGLQYQVSSYIALMLDAGADYNGELSEESVVRAAAQFTIYNDFFLRAGFFDDKIKLEKGSGFGIGWVQPKLALDFAMKNFETFESTLLNQEDDTIKETSFSISYRF